jgi:hypothetical protein
MAKYDISHHLLGSVWIVWLSIHQIESPAVLLISYIFQYSMTLKKTVADCGGQSGLVVTIFCTVYPPSFLTVT